MTCVHCEKAETDTGLCQQCEAWASEPVPAKKQTLFQIGADAQALNDLLVELEGDISDPAVAEAIDEWLQETGDALDKKLDGYGALIREREALAAARKAEAQRLLDLAKTDENTVKRLKDRLQFFFENNGISKQETARFKFSLAANGGKAPVIIDGNYKPDEVPFSFQKQVVDFDKEEIRKALEAGDELSFARLGERGRSLRIK